MAVLGDAIYNLVSAQEADVYPDIVPQGITKPSVSYSIISNVPSDDKDGVSALDVYRVQLNIYAEGYRECDQLATNIRTDLDRYSGTSGSVVIQSIRFDTEFGDYDSTAKLYYRIQDYLIRVKK